MIQAIITNLESDKLITNIRSKDNLLLDMQRLQRELVIGAGYEIWEIQPAR